MRSKPGGGAALLRKGGLGHATGAMAATMELARRAASGVGGPWAAGRAIRPPLRPPGPIMTAEASAPHGVAAAGTVAPPSSTPALPFALAATGAPHRSRPMFVTASASSLDPVVSLVPGADRRNDAGFGISRRSGRVPGAAAAMMVEAADRRSASTDFGYALSLSAIGQVESASVTTAPDATLGASRSMLPSSSAEILPGAAIAGAPVMDSPWRAATRANAGAESFAAALAADPPLAWAPPAAGGWSASVAPKMFSAEALRSFAPPAQASGGGPVSGDVHLDGVRMGRWVADRMARELGRPQTGSTAFDPTRSPRWPGTLQGS